MAAIIDDFDSEVTCYYKNELYTVRDNGAVLRKPRDNERPRPTDNKWTFGKLNVKTGYLEIGSVRIHRIIAMAFHGEPPHKEHVVDHIDTNKHNNRPENLRWVTRLENVLLNPITAKRIATVCGSVEAFLADPSKYRDKFREPNYQWMCTVSKQEAQLSLKRLLAWAKSDNSPSGGSLGDWIFNRANTQISQDEKIPAVPDIIMAKTLNAAQRNWSTPSEFPCCPQDHNEEPVKAYAENLKAGAVFCRNDIYSSLVSKIAISDDRQMLYVLSESTQGKMAIKLWALATIVYENGLYIHTSIQSFSTKEGAEKQFCLEQGLEWSGGDPIDDYC